MDGGLVLLRALADETRLKILGFLQEGERCVCEIIPCTGKSQPNVSLHLKKLEDAGILKSRKEGTKVFYSVSDERTRKILALLEV